MPWNWLLSMLPRRGSLAFGGFKTYKPYGPMCFTFSFFDLGKNSSFGSWWSLCRYRCSCETIPKLFTKIGFSSICSKMQNLPSLSESLKRSLKYSSALMIPLFLFFLFSVSLSMTTIGISTLMCFADPPSFPSSLAVSWLWLILWSTPLIILPLASIDMWVDYFMATCSFRSLYS